MTFEHPGPMSIDEAEKLRPGFAEQFRRLEKMWPVIIGPRPSTDETPAYANLVVPSGVRGATLVVRSNNPSESIRVLGMADWIVAKTRALGLLEITSIAIDPIKQGSYQDAVDDGTRAGEAWTRLRETWPSVAGGRGVPVMELDGALVIHIDIATPDDVYWFGQNQVAVVRAARACGLENVSTISLRPPTKTSAEVQAETKGRRG